MKAIISISLFLLGAVYGQGSFEVEKTSFNHRKIRTEIVIEAPMEEVWEVLTDFNGMAEWSSNALQKIEGKFEDQETVRMYFKPNPKSEKLRVETKLLHLDKDRSFGWEGGVIMMGMKDKHYYRLEDLGEGKTRFVQTDEAIGGWTWMLGGQVMKRFRDLYTSFNLELRTEVLKRERENR